MSKEHEDTLRLDCLSDPGFQIHYSICADGSARLGHPKTGDIYPNLRAAIDVARADQNRIPRCPSCNKVVTEDKASRDGMTQRWECTCGTSFLWPH